MIFAAQWRAAAASCRERTSVGLAGGDANAGRSSGRRGAWRRGVGRAPGPAPLAGGGHEASRPVAPLPGLGLPIPATPWLLIAAGAGLVAGGALSLWRRDRITTALLLAAGVGLIAVPL